MITIFKELYYGLGDLWATDRKEFWEIVGGFIIVTFWMWFSIFVLIPIFGD